MNRLKLLHELKSLKHSQWSRGSSFCQCTKQLSRRKNLPGPLVVHFQESSRIKQFSFTDNFLLLLSSMLNKLECLILNISFIRILASVVKCLKLPAFSNALEEFFTFFFLVRLDFSHFSQLIVSFLDFYFCFDAFCSTSGRFCLFLLGLADRNMRNEVFLLNTQRAELQQSYQRRLTKVVRFPSFDPFPRGTFQVASLKKRHFGTWFSHLSLIEVLKLIFGCLSGRQAECFQRFLRINSRRSPDINEGTLWILCVQTLSGCVFFAFFFAWNLSTSLTSSENLTIFFPSVLLFTRFGSVFV